MPFDFGVYLCVIDDVMSSVVVNLAARPDPVSKYLIRMTIPIQHPNLQGMSTMSEGPELDAMEALVEENITSAQSGVYVGKITHSGQIDLYFYAKSRSGLETLGANSVGMKTGYQTKIAIREDPNWSFYREVICPNSPKDRQQVLNFVTIERLKEVGVDLSVSRQIHHFAKLPTAAAAEELAQDVVGMGFSIANVEGVRVKFCQLERAQLDVMNQVALVLIDMCQKYDGQYDGWEVAVESTGAKES